MSRRKKKSSAPAVVIAMLLVAVAVVALVPTGSAVKSEPSDTCNVDFTDLEKISIPGALTNEMLHYEGFTVAFNAEAHQPNYVVWTLTPEHTDGPYTRNSSDVNFAPDARVNGCATLADYKRSGFDRGHMAPAADNKWSHEAMKDCHYLTNMCPQDNKLNAGAWATVEKNTRKWVERHGTLVIVAGPVLSDRLTRTIGQSEIPVPERFFKVILAPEANPPMGIGFIMPNSYVEGGAQSTVVSIDQVEAVTGFDFFAALPDSIENIVESQNSIRIWNK